MEVISRAEEYLNYALKQQETYPIPISRIDYYLLSLAQEVRSGGADPATIENAVNNYLTENPPSAMTDEAIATSVNNSIASGAIEVMSEVEDGSVTIDKLNYENVFGAIQYEVNKSGAWCTFSVNLNGTTGLTSNLEFTFVSDTILDGLVKMVVKYVNQGLTSDVAGLTYIDNGDGTYTYTGTMETLKGDVNSVLLQYRGTTGTLLISGTFSNISVVIDGVKVESTVLIEDGVTTNKEANPTIATKNNLNESTSTLNNKINNGLLYARNKVYENQLKNLKLAYSVNKKSVSKFTNTNCADIEEGGVKITGGGEFSDTREITPDTFSMEMIFDVIDTTTSTKFGFFTRSEAIFMVNVSDNSLEILKADINYGTDDGDVIVSKTIPWTLTSSEKYKLALVKDELTYTLILTNLATGESISIYTTLCYMFGTGRVGIKTYGTTAINVYKYDYYLSNYKYSNVLIMGDSITQGVGLTDISNRWCGKLLKEHYEGDGVIWGKGFDTSSNTLTRLTNIFNFGYKFNKVIIMIGTNNAGSDESYSKWETDIVDIYNLIVDNGAEPIICVPPSKRANMSNVLKMRDFILSKGWNTIRMDIATSVDQLGEVIDENITTDGTHFNDEGNLRMYERAVKDLNNGILLEDNNDHTHDYSEITNTPTIPTKTSDLTNDSGYITKTVDNLTNYYLKTETYTQEEINELLGNVNHLTTTIVDTLPTENISTTTIYLVKVGDTTNYTQHMYINNTWADLGTTQIDLTDYYNKTQANSIFATQDSLNTHTSDTDIHTTAEEKAKWNEVDNKIDKTSIIDTYNVNVTSEQVFGAKVMYSKLAEGFNGVLRQGCTVTDNDMNNLITPGQYETVWNTANFTNLPPVKAGSSRMRVKVEQLSSNCYRQEIEFQAGAVSKGTWFRIYVDNSWSDWGKICTTSVEDVSETDITCTLPSTVNALSVMTKYVVKNGIANISISWTLNSAAKTSWANIASNLPTPLTLQRFYLIPEANNTNPNISLSIDTNGVMNIYIAKDTVGGDWWKGTITYPVA